MAGTGRDRQPWEGGQRAMLAPADGSADEATNAVLVAVVMQRGAGPAAWRFRGRPRVVSAREQL